MSKVGRAGLEHGTKGLTDRHTGRSDTSLSSIAAQNDWPSLSRTWAELTSGNPSQRDSTSASRLNPPCVDSPNPHLVDNVCAGTVGCETSEVFAGHLGSKNVCAPPSGQVDCTSIWAPTGIKETALEKDLGESFRLADHQTCDSEGVLASVTSECNTKLNRLTVV
jgi:hypothetical protein